MKILYYSVHAVLEYDETLLLHEMGHEVFSLGLYFGNDPDGPPRPELHIRPRLPVPTNQEAMAVFVSSGCRRSYPNNSENTWLSKEFLELFDAFIVMHDVPFIVKNWNEIKTIPVVWRTIGQGLSVFDTQIAEQRREGLRVVGYSPNERHAPGYAGRDAIIRFYRDERLYGPWNGHVRKALHYTTSFSYRYPIEYDLFVRSLEGIDYALGSGGNDDNPNAFGQDSYDDQRQALSDYRCYFYCCAFTLPYNLAYIEAAITGMPMIVYADATLTNSLGNYYEAPELIEDGVSGLVVHSVEEANDAILRVLGDDGLAQSLSVNGRQRAIGLFSRGRAVDAWSEFLSTL